MNPARPPRRRWLSATIVLTLAVSACGSEDRDPTPVDERAPAPSLDDLNVDSDIDEGVETETDEGRNTGFESDEDSGNGQNVND